MMTNSVLLGLLITGFSFGQTLSFGVLGGAPFTNVVNEGPLGAFSSIKNNASNFTVGPAVQLNLPLGFRVEADALYRPYGFGTQGSAVPYVTSITNFSAQQWSFPVLLQYRFAFPVIRPFVEVGPSFQHLSGISQADVSFLQVHSSNVGVVIGGGVDLKVPIIRLSAELRYTRETQSYYGSASNQNQAEVLFGIHF